MGVEQEKSDKGPREDLVLASVPSWEGSEGAAATARLPPQGTLIIIRVIYGALGEGLGEGHLHDSTHLILPISL